jgi:23S rRNA pseudouridine1911/1915/1917 synthase
VATYSSPAVVSLLRCRLETGRTHQIRVHLAAIEHPVVGDARYRGRRRAIDAPRPMLHAAELAFTHPRTGKEVSFTAEVPSDMAAVLASLA